MPHVRLSVRGPKMKCVERFQWDCSAAPNRSSLTRQFEAIVGSARLIRPRYALANLGHPSSFYQYRLGD